MITAPGYYKLTQDIDNPRPDGRVKRRLSSASKTWLKGTVVHVTPLGAEIHKRAEEFAGERLPVDETPLKNSGVVTFADGSWLKYDIDAPAYTLKHFPQDVAGNGLVQAVEPSSASLGQLLRGSAYSPVELLCLLLDAGKLKLGDIEAVRRLALAADLAMPDGSDRGVDAPEFCLRHGI